MSSRPSIDERFARFNNDNPLILAELITLARDAKARGYNHYSLKALWEVLRFSSDPTTAEQYRLPNDFTSRYARRVMRDAPDLDGFFETRSLQGDEPKSEPDEDEPLDF